MGIRATNTKTGVTKDFTPLEWELMQDWPSSDWQKVPAEAPKEAVKAAMKVKEIKSEKDITL